MSSRSQKALKIAAVVVLSIAAVIFVILYLTGQVDDFLGVTNTSESSSVAQNMTQGTQSDVSMSQSTSSALQSTTQSSSGAPQSTQTAVNTSESTASVQQSTPESTVSVSQSTQPVESTPESTPTVQTTYRFRNRNLLNQHYEKHGREMGFASAADYEKAAAAVVNNPAALHKIEKEDGDDVYYVESTNEFVVVSTDGYIRTYFLPDRGIDYYNKQ